MTTHIIVISIATLVYAILLIVEDKKVKQHNKKLVVLQQTVNRNKLKDYGCDIDHIVQRLESMDIHYSTLKVLFFCLKSDKW